MDRCARSCLLLFALAFSPLVLGQALHWLSQPDIDIGPVINGDKDAPQVSANGQFVTFSSSASNLVPGDTNQLADLFIQNLNTGELRRVNVRADGSETTDSGVDRYSAATSDGRFVVFSTDSDQFPGRMDYGNVYLKDLQTNEVSFIADYDGTSGFYTFEAIHLTDDARYLTFNTSTEIDPLHDSYHAQVYRKDLQTGVITLITRSLDGLSAADSTMRLKAVSPNGRYVVFAGRAQNLVPELSSDADVDHLFLADMVDETIELVTITPEGQAASEPTFGFARNASVSNDGKVVFESQLSDLVAGDTNDLRDLFLYQSGEVERLNLTPGGQQVADFDVADGVAINGNGTRVVYGTRSAQIVPVGSNDDIQLYALELSSGLVQRISQTPTGAGDSISESPVMSVSGQRVLFRSLAGNFPGNGSIGLHYGLFGYDFASGQLNSYNDVSFNPNTQIGTLVGAVRTSSDQMSVIYTFRSPNLSADAAGDLLANVYLLDRHSNTHQVIARNVFGSATLSPSGRYAAFVSSHFPPEGTIDLGQPFVFLHDRQEGTFIQIAQGSSPAVNDQGRVAFSSSVDLAANDTNETSDIYVFYPGTSELRLVSESTSGEAGNSGSFGASISAGTDDFRVVFQSNATDLIVSQDTSQTEAFLAEFPSGLIRRISQTPAGVGGDKQSDEPSISSDGSWVAFRSQATNLTADDYEDAYGWQVLVYEVATELHELASINGSGLPFADSFISRPSISDSGRYVAYRSHDNMNKGIPDFPGDSDDSWDVFLFDRQTGITRLVSQFIDGSDHDEDVRFGHVVEDLTLTPPRVGVVFAANGQLAGVSNAPGYHDAFLYQRGGPPINLELTVEGDGQVSGSFGINCSTVCSYSQPLGTDLALVASAGPDATFLGWENDFGPCNHSDNPCQLSLDRDQSLTARFGDPVDEIFSSRFE